MSLLVLACHNQKKKINRRLTKIRRVCRLLFNQKRAWNPVIQSQAKKWWAVTQTKWGDPPLLNNSWTWNDWLQKEQRIRKGEWKRQQRRKNLRLARDSNKRRSRLNKRQSWKGFTQKPTSQSGSEKKLNSWQCGSTWITKVQTSGCGTKKIGLSLPILKSSAISRGRHQSRRKRLKFFVLRISLKKMKTLRLIAPNL